jgi:acetyltransferase-like isoleucine patch superfamily enzyme
MDPMAREACEVVAAPARNPSGPAERYGVLGYVRAAIYFTLYGLVKYLPSPLGDLCRAGVLRFFAASIQSWWIKDGVTVWFPEGVSIGRHVSVNEGVFIDGFGGIRIGDCCRIAHGCSLISEDHVFSDPTTPIFRQGKVKGPVVLGRDVWLGAGVRVLRGVTIGEGSVIGAGAVVTRDIPPFSIAVGVPARVVGSRGAGQDVRSPHGSR